MRFEDRVAVVTGAASGIGEATAHRFAAEGASVVAADVDRTQVASVVARIVAEGGTAVTAVGDLGDADTPAALIDIAATRFGRLDFLVNNAGIPSHGSITTTTEQDWHRTFDVNLHSAFRCCRYAAPLMCEQGGGVILFTSSVGGVQGTVAAAAYNATKAALVSMTQSMALDYGHRNVRVNCVCPGSIRTPPLAARLAEHPALQDVMSAMTPLRRLGEPRDIADAFVFLASDEASYITGQSLVVDGGISVGTYLPQMLDPRDEPVPKERQ